MNIFPLLENKSIYFKINVDTSAVSHIKAGGIASAVAYPDTVDKLIYIIRLAKESGARYKIIGGCSNTYFSDSGFEGILISTVRLNEAHFESGAIKLGAGVYLSSAIAKACGFGLDFAPSLIGIPGTVGGALRNNAGAMGSEISDYFLEGVFFSPKDDKTIVLKREELSFSYRSSRLFSEELVLLSGDFVLGGLDARERRLKMEAALEYRRRSHPKLPSLGSFFKRSGEIIPAALIESAGLKGKRVGDAAVSELHSGFIVNLGKATARDITRLSDEIEAQIYEKFGVILEKEAELVE